VRHRTDRGTDGGVLREQACWMSRD
jgi:hypothetical protein